MKRLILVLSLASSVAACGREPAIAWEVQSAPLGTFEAVESETGRALPLRVECTALAQPETWTCRAPIDPSMRRRLIRVRRTVNGRTSVSQLMRAPE